MYIRYKFNQKIDIGKIVVQLKGVIHQSRKEEKQEKVIKSRKFT